MKIFDKFFHQLFVQVYQQMVSDVRLGNGCYDYGRSYTIVMSTDAIQNPFGSKNLGYRRIVGIFRHHNG